MLQEVKQTPAIMNSTQQLDFRKFSDTVLVQLFDIKLLSGKKAPIIQEVAFNTRYIMEHRKKVCFSLRILVNPPNFNG